MDGQRQSAVSLLTDVNVRRAFDIRQQPEKDLHRYGSNAFGWSPLLAARLVEAGITSCR